MWKVINPQILACSLMEQSQALDEMCSFGKHKYVWL